MKPALLAVDEAFLSHTVLMKRVVNLLISWCFLARGERGPLDHTSEFDMNNLDKLWAYIKEKAPPGGIPGHDDRKFRDLKQYYEKKLSLAIPTPDEEMRQFADQVVRGR